MKDHADKVSGWVQCAKAWQRRMFEYARRGDHQTAKGCKLLRDNALSNARTWK